MVSLVVPKMVMKSGTDQSKDKVRDSERHGVDKNVHGIHSYVNMQIKIISSLTKASDYTVQLQGEVYIESSDKDEEDYSIDIRGPRGTPLCPI